MNQNILPELAENAATVCFYTDTKPATVIRRTDKEIVVREDNAELLNGANSNAPDKLVAHVGGFCAHVTGTQRYAYTENPDGQLYRFTLRKNGKFVQAGAKMSGTAGVKLVLGRRRKFYDYNF